MNRPVATLQILEEDTYREFAATLPYGWTYAWMRLKETGQVTLVEVYKDRGWCFASVDFIDRTLFDEIEAEDVEFYGGKSYAAYQGEVLSAMALSGLIRSEPRPLPYCEVLDPPIQE